ncbi:Glutamyl-tRNA synthetase @ Glutamyl-tRNA(Gln) synthetase [hydrothermal vent metagenome]|uniref:glutamate--tRNA ligase n=1 Tax=hydrothermal vent metagenome TaxID=652676 RepID=A0A3B0VLA8_9ZZZZ
MTTVITRIPPSPTGRFHIGTARTALFNYLFARHHNGRIVFRSEDTDKTRSKKEYEDEIINGLHWLGITWDEFSRQSEHTSRYRALLEKLINEGKAYISKEQSKNDSSKTVEIVRLKNPGREITFNDIIRGDITFDTTELGDFVIARSLDDALYHFAVVVDDMDAGVTHVIRGEDGISNTPRQILIQEAIDAKRPAYAHLPLILDEKRAKLSKRSGATSVMDYRDEGFLPEAIVNYLALLGWNPGGDREYFSLTELVDVFSLDNVQKGGASWNRDKLISVNQRWMRKLSDTEYLINMKNISPNINSFDETLLTKTVPLLKERARTFSEALDMLSGELACIFTPPKPEHDILISKEPDNSLGATQRHLETLISMINSLPNEAPADIIKTMLMPYADKEGRAEVLWPLRYALSGQKRSPDPFTLIEILGNDESVKRINAALAILVNNE